MENPFARPSPATPSSTVPRATRRAFTLPRKLSGSSQMSHRSNDSAADGVEILFSHDSGKIVAFSPAGTSWNWSPGSSRRESDANAELVGVLPWTSRTERIIATGPLQLYRAHSVAFLSSGSILHPILAKSQCWCVDGETKFVLRIRGNSFYRIELPNDGQQDKDSAEALKVVFSNILLYEKTACPFKRSFTVELPEPPKNPAPKRPWQPASRRSTAEISEIRAPSSLRKPVPAPSDDSSTTGTDQHGGDVTDAPVSETTDEAEFTPSSSIVSSDQERISSTPAKLPMLTTARSITGPPHLSLRTRPPPVMVLSQNIKPPSPQQPLSAASSVESFHSIRSTASSSPPVSPCPVKPSDRDPIILPRVRPHKRELFDSTPSESAPRRWDVNGTVADSDLGRRGSSPPPMTPGLVPDVDDRNDEEPSEIATPPRLSNLGRQVAAGQRTHSPLSPHSAVLFPSSPPGQFLTAALVQKTCSLMLGTSAQLVSLMLSIARKVVSGMLQGVVIGIGEGGEKIPCSWLSSDDEDQDDDGWEEDDYSIRLTTNNGHDLRQRDIGESWELD